MPRVSNRRAGGPVLGGSMPTSRLWQTLDRRSTCLALGKPLEDVVIGVLGQWFGRNVGSSFWAWPDIRPGVPLLSGTCLVPRLEGLGEDGAPPVLSRRADPAPSREEGAIRSGRLSVGTLPKGESDSAGMEMARMALLRGFRVRKNAARGWKCPCCSQNVDGVRF